MVDLSILVAVPTRTSEGVRSYIRPGWNVIDLWTLLGVKVRVGMVLDVELGILLLKKMVLVKSDLNNHIL